MKSLCTSFSYVLLRCNMANQKIIEQKQNVVNEISDKIKNSSSVVWFEYQGLTVSETNELRRLLRETDSDFKVYKNTLVTRALKDLEIELNETLEGPKAIAFGKDAVAPIKTLSDFSKKHQALELKVGIVDGEVANIDTLKQLATIPVKKKDYLQWWHLVCLELLEILQFV